MSNAIEDIKDKIQASITNSHIYEQKNKTI
jgi:hypothetical protein